MIATDPRWVPATAVSARALAPDLARGVMLLLIALANVHLYLSGHPIGVRGYPVPVSAGDRLVALVQMTLVDGRAYPMFALLFGYGTVQLLRRQRAGAVPDRAVRALVRRRGRWLLAFGFGHALLLFSGDILGAYGLLAVLLAGVMLQAPDRMLLILAGLSVVPPVALGALQGLSTASATTSVLPSMSGTDPLVAAWSRIVEWVALVPVTVFSLLPAVLLGVWAARRRVLEEPERYRSMLVLGAVLGVGLAAAGGLPMALMAASWWPDPSVTQACIAGAVHALTGYAGGLGYAAIAGLVAIAVRRPGGRRPHPVLTALAACGQRSMTCYLLQSVVFVAVLASYGGGLGARLGLADAALLATATWALTVVLAEFMRRRGHRGPAEILLRRLTYRPAPTVSR